MLCKQCGRENENDAAVCAYCMAEGMEYSEVSHSVSDTEEEATLGFSKAESEYDPPKLLSSVTKVNPQTVNEGKTVGDQVFQAIVRDTGDFHHHKNDKEIDKAMSRSSGRSKRKEKKITNQRQLSLHQALQTRLKEDKQEALSQYMYRGLNQDIVEEEEKQTGKKNRIIRRSFVGITIGILLALCLLFYIGSKGEKTDYMRMTKNAIEIYSSQSDSKTYVFNAQGDMLFKTNGYYQPYYTSDHSAAIIFNWNERTGIYVNNSRWKAFDSKIDTFALSEDGNFILYSIPGGLGKYYLRLYDVMKDIDILIDNQAKRFDLLNVLPGGKMISYLTYTLSAVGNPQEIQSYLVRNKGTPELVGDNICIFAISYDMNSIYYYTLKDTGLDSIYVRNGEREQCLSDNITNSVYFNKDYSQILVADGESYYFSDQGTERIKIVDRMAAGILLPSRGITSVNSPLFRSYGIDHFDHKLLICNDNTIQMFQGTQVKEIAVTSDNDKAMLSEDGSSLLYLDTTNNLILLTDIYSEAKQNILAENVKEYQASDDFTQIYFLRDADLYYIGQENKERRISEDIRDLCRSYEGNTVFFLKDYINGEGTLYYSRNGEQAQAVEGGNRVNGVREWNFGVIYQKLVNGSNAVFYNTKGTNFLFIMDGINLLGTKSH